jgi:hypothetical protein
MLSVLLTLTRVSVPVILVLTKFDLVVSQILLDSFSGAPQYYERARASAHTAFEESCRRTFNKEPRDVPAEIVSGICPFLPVHWRGQLTSLHRERKIQRSHRESSRDH